MQGFTSRLTRRMALLALAAATLASVGCGGVMNVRTFARQGQGRSIAVVSLAVNDFGNSLQGWNSTLTGDLMTSRAATMVQIAEGQLANRFNVVPAAAFVASPAYLSVPQGRHEVGAPVFAEGPMPVFALSRGDLVRAELRPEQAQALAQATGTDFIAVVYSEWGVATGGMIPTSKALAKTIVTIYDADGVRVASQRDDERGERTLGAFGRVVVDENSIDEWVGAFERSVALMVRE
jgi:hypothetical protein